MEHKSRASYLFEVCAGMISFVTFTNARYFFSGRSNIVKIIRSKFEAKLHKICLRDQIQSIENAKYICKNGQIPLQVIHKKKINGIHTTAMKKKKQTNKQNKQNKTKQKQKQQQRQNYVA